MSGTLYLMKAVFSKVLRNSDGDGYIKCNGLWDEHCYEYTLRFTEDLWFKLLLKYYGNGMTWPQA